MKYGLIGKKLSHSYSQLIHNAIGGYDYRLLELAPDELGAFLDKKEFIGINVTIPYKKDVIPYCAELSAAARKIGSVNTIVNRNGRLYGHNTDYDGFIYMARRANIDFDKKKVLILGSGGTSLTASHAAVDQGARQIIIVSREGKVNYGNIYAHDNADIIINTTPVGMYPDNGSGIISLEPFKALHGVIDVIYNPLKTKLMLDAAALGVKHISGLSMLAAQAVYASELFFDTQYGDRKIEDIISLIEGRVLNIVLVGMPGCGKTSVGKALALDLGREFIDTDSEIEKRLEMSIPDVFSKFGEDYFRSVESEVIADVSKNRGAVIATGGGAPIKEENRRALMQNGYICFLERSLDSLDISGRPLSKTGALDRLYDQRLPLYLSMCDVRVRNDNEPTDAVRKIKEAFLKRK